MKENKNGNVPYSVLKQEERTIEPVVEKRKKSHRRGYAWFLGIVSILGLGYGAKKIYDDSNIKYNNDIKSAYVQTIDYLRKSLPNPATTIDGIRFYEPEEIEQSAKIEIFATLDEDGDGTSLRHYDYFYELAYQYYESLKTAENSGDFKNYVNVLNLCFDKMELVSKKYNYPTTNFEFNAEQAQKFNEFFNLNEYGLNQVGFLPQFIDYVTEVRDGTNYVTYTIKGLSFVETENEKGDGVLPKDLSNAVLSQNLNKNNIKVYETDFKFTYDLNAELLFDKNDFLIALHEYFGDTEQVVQNLKVLPTYVNEVDLTSFKMQENVFDFEKEK